MTCFCMKIYFNIRRYLSVNANELVWLQINVVEIEICSEAIVFQYVCS